MPLLDHFRAPLDRHWSWESFHSTWANSIRDALNRQLPRRYFALVQLHLGSRVEADVAEFEKLSGNGNGGDGKAAAGGVAVETWAPPKALVAHAVFPDDLEVQILDQDDDARLVGVVELVSPRNKDRPESRRAFAVKTAAYLQRGVGLITLDVVTIRQFNLHNELVDLVNFGPSLRMPDDISLYGVGYHPVRREDANQIDIWPMPLTIGQTLPLIPLGLRGGVIVPLDVEAAYTDARQRSRL